MNSRREEKERRREERLAREAAEQRAAARRRRLQMAGGVVGLLAVAALVVALVAPGEHANSSPRRSGSGLLASTAGEAKGAAVDGILCQTDEQAIYHIHAHLAVYVNGRQRAVPDGIGIPPPRNLQQSSEGPFVVSGACFYWLHSHTRDGIIHIESPVQRTYTLGNYFDIWKRPLGPGRVGPAKARVTAYLNGRRYTGNPRSIPLSAHALVQLDIGTPVVAPAPYTFPSGL